MSVVTLRFEKFRQSILRELALAARRQARPRVPSRTLRRTMSVEIGSRSAVVRNAHYWAIYLHDGTKALLRAPTQRGKSAYVFFRKRQDDPRLAGGFPVRARETKSLTRGQYLAGLAENVKRRKLGQPPFMYVFKVLKASHPKPGAQWFSNRVGMLGFPQEGARVVTKRFDSLVRSLLPSDRQSAKLQL